MNLIEAVEGKEVAVKNVHSGKELRLRLCELGLFEGSKIKVIRNRSGPVLIGVFGSMLAIGRGQAAKIEVIL